jgi:membrane fusion protein (multidrug efflux system)
MQVISGDLVVHEAHAAGAHVVGSRRRIAAVGGRAEALARLRGVIEPVHELACFGSGSDLLGHLSSARPEVVVVLGEPGDFSLRELLLELQARTQQWNPPLAVVLYGDRPAMWQTDPTTDELIAYRVDSRDEGVGLATIKALVDNLGVPHVLPPVPSHDAKILPANMAAEKLAQIEGNQLRGAIESRSAALMHADRTYCLFYDSASNSLWREGAEIDGDRFTAAEGLAALAARCGQTFLAPNVSHDPRYLRMRDDPFGQGNEQLLLQPVPSRTGEIHAVLCIVRRAEAARFTQDDIVRAQRFASSLTGILDAYDAAHECEDTGVSHPLSIFRREALEAHDAPPAEGDVVRISPRWVSAVYKVTLALASVAMLFICFGTVGTYREGPAIVQILGRTSVTSALGGTISSVVVRDGQFVKKGTPIVRLDDHREAASLARQKEQFEQALTAVLRDPGDEGAKMRVAELKAQLVSARAELEDRMIVAPHDGIVRGLRVRAGQSLQPGDSIATIVEDETELSLVAMVPGDAGPMLRKGQNLRLELTTHGRAFQDLTVESIDDEIIGPTEARRFLGPELADAIPLGGPVVLVRTKLPSDSFEIDGTVYTYREGMSGTARIRLRDEPIIFAILPALRQVR